MAHTLCMPLFGFFLELGLVASVAGLDSAIAAINSLKATYKETKN